MESGSGEANRRYPGYKWTGMGKRVRVWENENKRENENEHDAE